MFLFTNEPSQTKVDRHLPQEESVKAAIRNAATDSGISFNYLLKTAKRESNLNETAKATTSSASGLYQFLDQTWLSTVKSEGSKYGLELESQQITQSSSGFLTVSDSVAKQKILGLRNDPAISSKLAAAFTNKNHAQLMSDFGRPPSDGELYIAHFLGSRGAGDLVRKAVDTPEENAAMAFPEAAKNNHSIFFEKEGRARTVLEVYSSLVSDFGKAVTVIEDAPEKIPLSPTAQSINNTYNNTYKAKEGGKPLFDLFHGSETGPVAEPIKNAWSSLGNNSFAVEQNKLKNANAPAVPLKPTLQKPLNLLSFIRTN